MNQDQPYFIIKKKQNAIHKIGHIKLMGHPKIIFRSHDRAALSLSLGNFSTTKNMKCWLNIRHLYINI